MVVAVVVAIATYLTWLASRLDRLARRVDVTRGGLVGQLVARAEAADTLATRCDLAALGEAARRARDGHPGLLVGASLDHAVEDAENALSRALRTPAVAVAGREAPDALHELDSAAARVALARQFYNDAVADVRALVGRRLVRALHLTGRCPPPIYFEIDDALPARGEDIVPGGLPDDPGGLPADVDVRPRSGRDEPLAEPAAGPVSDPAPRTDAGP